MKSNKTPIQNRELEQLLEEVLVLGQLKNLKISYGTAPNNFSLFHYGDHIMPESWKIEYIPPIEAYNANYFAHVDQAQERLFGLSKVLPASKITKTFFRHLNRKQITENELFMQEYLTKDLSEISEFLRAYFSTVRLQNLFQPI
jgi:hypothetical protein